MLITPANLNTVTKDLSSSKPVKTVFDTPNKTAVNCTKKIKSPQNIDSFEKQKKKRIQRWAIDGGLIVLALALLRSSALSSRLKFEKKMADGLLATIDKIKVDMQDFVRSFDKEKVELAKHIDFVKAKTLEEAKDFAKTHLKTDMYVVDDLEIANWINKYLTKYNNMFEGKRILPRNIFYSETLLKETSSAQMATTLSHINTSTLTVSKKSWKLDESLLNSMSYNIELSRLLYSSPFGKFESEFANNTTIDELEKIAKLVTDMSNNPQNYTKPQKNTIVAIYENTIKKFDFLKDPANSRYYINYLKDKAKYSPEITKVINNMHNCNAQELKETALKMMKECGYTPTYGLKAQEEGGTIFHELGHLAIREDEAKELYNFYLEQLARISKSENHVNKAIEDLGKFKNKIKYFFFMKKPDIKMDLKLDWFKYYKTDDAVLSKEEKIIASMISDYAATAPGEFIAETFAALCERGIDKFSKDIIDMYKKFKGPLIEFFENKTNAA